MKTTLIFFLTAIMAMAQAPPADPAWWSQGNPPVIIPGAPQNNKGPANIGQAKYMAKRALEALNAVSPSLAADIQADLVGSGKAIDSFEVPPNPTSEWLQSQKAPLLVGQLKAIAAPFYENIHAAAPAWLLTQRTLNGTNIANTHFPWSQTSHPQNKSMATIGQLKAVFALRWNFDSDNDNQMDLIEYSVLGGLNISGVPASLIAFLLSTEQVYSPNGDYDGDGVSNATEIANLTDLMSADTDGDGLQDGVDPAPLTAQSNASVATELILLTPLQ